MSTNQTIPQYLQAIFSPNNQNSNFKENEEIICSDQLPYYNNLLSPLSDQSVAFIPHRKVALMLDSDNNKKQFQTKFLQFHQFLKTKYTSRMKYIACLAPLENYNSYRPLSQQSNKFQKEKDVKISSSSVYKKKMKLNLNLSWNIESVLPSSQRNTIDEEHLKYSRKWTKKSPKRRRQIDRQENFTDLVFLHQSKTPYVEAKEVKIKRKFTFGSRNCKSRLEECPNLSDNKSKMMMIFPEDKYDGMRSVDTPSKLKCQLQQLKKVMELRKVIPNQVAHLKRQAEKLFCHKVDKIEKASFLSSRQENHTQIKMEKHQQKILNYTFYRERDEGRGKNDCFQRIREFEESAKINITKKQVYIKKTSCKSRSQRQAEQLDVK